MKLLKKSLIFLFILAAAVIMSSCKTNKGGNEETIRPDYEFEPVGEVVEGRKNIYMVLKVMTSQYWKDVANGAAEAAEEQGCNLYIGGPSAEDNWQFQQKLIKEACEKKADAILLAPANSSELADAADEVEDADIPLVLVDTILTSGHYDVCYMTDNFSAGALAAEETLKMLHENGTKDSDSVKVGIQVTSTGSQTVVDRIAGFNKYWFENAPHNWNIIDEVKFNMGDEELALKNGRDFLKDYPELKALVACNNSSSVGFAKSIAESGRKDVILSAFDYSDEVSSLIKDKNYTAATVVQRQDEMGSKGVCTALELADGKSSDYKFTDTGVMVVNEGNYADYESNRQK